MLKRKRRTFNWQINASSVGKLLGYFGEQRAIEALAQTWHMNLKRMPRFGVTPSIQLNKQTTQEITEAATQAPAFKQMVQRGVDNPTAQAQVITEMKREAVHRAQKASTAAVKAAAALANVKTMRNYNTKKAGVGRAAINSYFTVDKKVYHKTSSRHATLSTVEEAATRGWVFAEQHEEQTRQVAAAKKEAVHQQKVAASMEKTATKVINTTRGQQKELTDLEIVRQTHPNVVAGNDKAYFLNIRGGGFIIGRIDGQDTLTKEIYELKHRRSKLFYEFRRYEQAQCMIYMKMLKVSQLTLVETYKQKQCYHHMREDNGQFYVRTKDTEWEPTLTWEDIYTSLEGVVQQLKKAEEDAEFRQILMDILF